jgi:Zinc dependent phospholipase C
MQRLLSSLPAFTLLILILTIDVRPAAAYSVLAHEAIVDDAWGDAIVPLMKARFPGATEKAIAEARAYAYGGSVIQDLGYYPFGSHYFTNLVHYVRSGDFVDALLRDARDVNEFAFALGALAHYASDNTGHPIAVNRTVPILYPKDRLKFGDEVIYVESPAHHVMAEFAFDVFQVSRTSFAVDAYHDFIGFEVAKSLLERAFKDTYSLDLKTLLLDEDLAIGTYRYAVSKTIPEMTRMAWRDKRDEIEKLTPGTTQKAFLYTLGRRQFEQDFGTKYRRPGIFARTMMVVLKILPKIGPLRSLAFKPLTPDSEKLFLDSFARTHQRYRALLLQARSGRLNLQDTDFDTGNAPRRRRNALADETYDQLLNDLAEKRFAEVPAALRENLVRYYRNVQENVAGEGKGRKREIRIREQLFALATP